jgi:hypothetical protein
MTFELQENGDGTVTLISAEGTIISAGTPINSDNLNNMENGIANSIALSDYVNHVAFATATNIGNDYSVELDPEPTAYVDGMAISFKVNVNSTGNVTINVNGLGAKPITTSGGDLFSDLIAQGVYTIRYNASTGNFILQGEGGVSKAVLTDFISDVNAILSM